MKSIAATLFFRIQWSNYKRPQTKLCFCFFNRYACLMTDGERKAQVPQPNMKKGGMLFVFHSLASALIYHADINIGWLLPGWLQSVGLLYQQAFIHPAEVKLWNTGPQMHPWSVHEKRKAPLGLTRIIAINVMKTLPSSGVTVPLFHCGWL